MGITFNPFTGTLDFTGAGGGGGGTPAAPFLSVQFNDSGSFGGNAGFVFDKTVQHGSIGPQASIDDGGSQGVVLFVAEDVTADLDDTTGLVNGIVVELNAVPTADVDFTQYIGQAITMNGNSPHLLAGSRLFALELDAHLLDGTVSTLQGIDLSVSNEGGGTIPTVLGAGIQGANNSASGITALTLLQMRAVNNDGTIGTTKAIEILAPIKNAGTMTASYGLYMGDQSVSGSSTNYAVDVNGKFRVGPDGGFTEGTEVTAPSAPAANGYRIFAQDNGGGKTQLMVLFSSGAAQQLAVQA